MKAQANGCNRRHIDDFLNSDHVGFDNAELIAHLDTCVACRHYMETQAAEPEQWSQATELLRPTEFDLASSAEYSAATIGHEPLERHAVIQSVFDLLTPSDDPNRLGRLGRFEISGVVGVGGMGVVLKAVDPALDRVVAIKVMAPHLAHHATARKRFSREAKAAAAVLHPNVVPIHCVPSDDKIPYLVMAYIRGSSLQMRLDREGPLSTVEVLRIGSQVAAGLAAAHDQGLIHRDIKPQNILLEEGVERVTLTDFGLARAVDDTSVTRDGSIAGTPEYMSPEQARGESIDKKSDLFSLGSVLYTLCTGRPPFRADSSYGVMRRISDEIPKPIRELNPDIPDWLAGIIEKLMAKQKAQRFDSAGEVHELLAACLNHVQQPTSVNLPLELLKKDQPTFAEHNTRPSFLKVIGLLSMLSLLTAMALGFFFFQEGAEPPQNDNAIHGDVLGHGYTRVGEFIYFDGQRIDQAGKRDIDEFAQFIGQDLTLCSDVDASSFKALSEEYTKDKNKAYYKWISPGRFWVVELPKADVKSFEVIGFNLARDSNHVWWYGSILSEIDAATVEVVEDGFVWKDAKGVWYQDERIEGADAKTFRHLDQAFYRDAKRVYWSSTPLDGADPDTFRTFGNESPYGADRNSVWKGDEKLTGVDAATFEPVHESVYKDKNGVYANGNPIQGTDPRTFHKVANLDLHLTALLADTNHDYIFLPYRGEVFLLESTAESLQVSRQIWAPAETTPQDIKAEPIATSTVELVGDRWRGLRISTELPDGEKQSLKAQEVHLLKIYRERFLKAWEILKDEMDQNEPEATTDNEAAARGLGDRPAP
jgi:serine/threonine protein kinase